MEGEEIPPEGRLSLSTKLIEIVFENIKEMFGQDLKTIKRCKDIAKESPLLDNEIKT